MHPRLYDQGSVRGQRSFLPPDRLRHQGGGGQVRMDGAGRVHPGAGQSLRGVVLPGFVYGKREFGERGHSLGSSG